MVVWKSFYVVTFYILNVCFWFHQYVFSLFSCLQETSVFDRTRLLLLTYPKLHISKTWQWISVAATSRASAFSRHKQLLFVEVLLYKFYHEFIQPLALEKFQFSITLFTQDLHIYEVYIYSRELKNKIPQKVIWICKKCWKTLLNPRIFIIWLRKFTAGFK